MRPPLTPIVTHRSRDANSSPSKYKLIPQSPVTPRSNRSSPYPRSPRLSSPPPAYKTSPLHDLIQARQERKIKEAELAKTLNHVKSLELEQMKMNLQIAKMMVANERIETASQVKQKLESDKLKRMQDLQHLHHKNQQSVHLVHEMKERMNQKVKQNFASKQSTGSDVRKQVHDLKEMRHEKLETIRKENSQFIHSYLDHYKEKKREISSRLQQRNEQNYSERREGRRRNEEILLKEMRHSLNEQNSMRVRDIREHRLKHEDWDQYVRQTNYNKVADFSSASAVKERNDVDKLAFTMEKLQHQETELRQKINMSRDILSRAQSDLRRSSSIEKYVLRHSTSQSPNHSFSNSSLYT